MLKQSTEATLVSLLQRQHLGFFTFGQADTQETRPSAAGWSALKEDYMMGARAEDWENEQSEDDEWNDGGQDVVLGGDDA